MIGIYRDKPEEAYINQHVSLVRPVLLEISEWIGWVIASPSYQQALGITGRGATKDGLTLDDIRNLSIPLPPLAEQREIVSRVEASLSRADAVEASLNAQTRQAQALRQAILKRAFAGDLVDQDPNDEPASVLLERIKAL